MSKVKVLYHKLTNTYWVNDINWKNRWKTENISFGTIEIDINNVKQLIIEMKKDGYYLELAKNIPFAGLSTITEDMVNNSYKTNIIQH